VQTFQIGLGEFLSSVNLRQFLVQIGLVLGVIGAAQVRD